MTVRMEQRVFGGTLCLLLRNDWSLRWLDVCICTDASEKGFAFAPREGCLELASEVRRVSERTKFKRRSRSIRAESRALRTVVPGAVSEQVRRRTRCRLPNGRVVLTSRRCPSAWELVVNGGSLRDKTSSFMKHDRSSMLFGVQKQIRRDVS